jgi:hypothetical protein
MDDREGRDLVKRPGVMDGGLAIAAGLVLYGAMAGIELALQADPRISAILEELGKALLLLVSGWRGGLGRRAILERNPVRLTRWLALGTARGLSLGLVAVAVFIGAENLGYLIAFPESGVLARLLWSLPVHLVAALAEALGALFLLRQLAVKGAIRNRLAGLSAWTGALVLAMAWHLTANLLVSHHLEPWTFTAGMVIANLLFLVLLLQFLKQAYLGGFLHGAD